MKNVAKRKTVVVISVFAILVLFAATFFIYVGTYYRCDEQAVNAYCGEREQVKVEKLSDGSYKFTGESTERGLIFYPGAKVQVEAYFPLMTALSEKGYVCFLVRMPFNLAVFKPNAAEELMKDNYGITSWIIGGHSLGGSIAAQYLSKNANGFSGLFMLGSYSISDVSATGVKVLSVYGQYDEVLDLEKYQKNKTNYPADLCEKVIEGGCHAGFGFYGTQKGDGKPTISSETQIEMTADIIAGYFVNQQSAS